MAPETSKFHYDVNTFIKAVKERRCLWDRAEEDHKHKVKKMMAWDEILRVLEPRYPDMDAGTREKHISILTSRWANLRDAFVRSLKNSSHASQNGYPPKPYVYHEQMKFLISDGNYDFLAYGHLHPQTEIVTDEHGEAEMTPLLTIDDITHFSPLVQIEQSDSCQDYSWEPTRSSKARGVNVKKRKSEQNCKCHRKTPVTDEDMSFFHSLLTPIKTLNMAEKMEFRIGVMALLQSLMNKGDDGDVTSSRKSRVNSESTERNFGNVVKEEFDVSSPNDV
ncbi:hypothetical protein EVAR_42588_1 [Eumeta japonica]|uniref:MADF domain-containing protein n=1 Tax=Eumeta variegata TaxID=151549 RepID=A0A4C1ZTN8_EUMVA|nr:hypothetical protein EVAR_42588_1 [Eumeta japonica]